MGDMQTQIDYPRGLDFEQVWAALMETRESIKETDRQIKEAQKETAQQIKETQQETDRQIKETQQETDRQIKEIGKRFGDFTNRFGEVVEYMIAPNLQDKLYDMGLDFQTVKQNM